MYGTTRAFLDYFSLKSLDDLPPLAEIQALIEPQLSDGASEDPHIPPQTEAAEANEDPRPLAEVCSCPSQTDSTP